MKGLQLGKLTKQQRRKIKTQNTPHIFISTCINITKVQKSKMIKK